LISYRKFLEGLTEFLDAGDEYTGDYVLDNEEHMRNLLRVGLAAEAFKDIVYESKEQFKGIFS
jgi:hypothetical protein